MPSANTPLLAEQQRHRPAYTDGDDDTSPKDDRIPPASRSRSLREIGLFTWALVATAAFVLLAVFTQHGHDQRHHPGKVPHGKRNLIFMVSDGMGPASLSLTRSYRQFVEDLPRDDTLTLDRHFWGTSRTRSSSSLVTDSAAGATAFSCGRKSYNGAISILPDYSPCGTVLEAAKRAGYHTGLVVTTAVTDATPACFASHALLRMMEDSIAMQEVGEGPLGRVVDLMLGGGRCHFLPNTTEGSCRDDDVDVVDIAKKKHGWHYASDRKAFDAFEGGENVKLPALGLFAPYNIPFELDRRSMNDVYPSLSEMATTALRALEKATEDSEHGFFLMIEGSRIDHGGHNNDPAAQVHEVLEYDKAFKAVLDFLDESSTEGVLVSTSDHETGGLSVALQEPGHMPVYDWYPAALHNVSASAEYLSITLQKYISSHDVAPARHDLRAWIEKKVVIDGLGIHNARDGELDALVDHPELSLFTLADMISLRAHVGWSSHGHSAVDVNVYSSGGPAADVLRGNVENIDVGDFLAKYLSVDVEAITKELRAAEKGVKAAEEDGSAAAARVKEYLETDNGVGRWANMGI
jgi:alkaline phosphatase